MLDTLYTVTIEATAAMVAILAGFLIARILALAAERQNLEREFEGVESQLSALEARQDEMTDLYETMRVERFFDAIKDEISASELPPLEQILRNHPDWKLDRIVVAREYEKLSRSLLEARQFVSEHADKIEIEDWLSFDDWVRNWNLDVQHLDDYDLAKQEYCRQQDRMFKVEREKRRSERARRDPFGLTSGLFLDDIGLGLGVWDPYREQLRLHEMRREDEELARVKLMLLSIGSQIAMSASKKDHLLSQLGAFRYPRRWETGLYILVFFSLVGIVLPLILIAISCDDARPGLAALAVIGLFVACLAAVFVYVWYQLHQSSASAADVEAQSIDLPR